MVQSQALVLVKPSAAQLGVLRRQLMHTEVLLRWQQAALVQRNSSEGCCQ